MPSESFSLLYHGGVDCQLWNFCLSSCIYCQVMLFVEVSRMRECSDPNVDLDDLIFDEEDGQPSNR